VTDFTKDYSGDGLLGGNSGGHFHLTRRNEASYIAVHVLLYLCIGLAIGLLVVTALALMNNHYGIEALQTVVAGSR
jgi:hypothetical protein